MASLYTVLEQSEPPNTSSVPWRAAAPCWFSWDQPRLTRVCPARGVEHSRGAATELQVLPSERSGFHGYFSFACHDDTLRLWIKTTDNIAVVRGFDPRSKGYGFELQCPKSTCRHPGVIGLTPNHRCFKTELLFTESLHIKGSCSMTEWWIYTTQKAEEGLCIQP